jgi:hypothetical protein
MKHNERLAEDFCWSFNTLQIRRNDCLRCPNSRAVDQLHKYSTRVDTAGREHQRLVRHLHYDTLHLHIGQGNKAQDRLAGSRCYWGMTVGIEFTKEPRNRPTQA